MEETWGMERDPASMNIFCCALYGNVVKSKKKKKTISFFFSFLIMKEKNERNHFSCDKLAVARDNGLQDIPVKSFQWDFACMDTDWIFRFCPAIWLLILPSMLSKLGTALTLIACDSLLGQRKGEPAYESDTCIR